MNLIMFALGAIFGAGLKFGFDYYHDFVNEQKRYITRMENTLAEFKAMQLMAEDKKNNVSLGR